jgi:hypothetical protein
MFTKSLALGDKAPLKALRSLSIQHITKAASEGNLWPRMEYRKLQATLLIMIAQQTMRLLSDKTKCMMLIYKTFFDSRTAELLSMKRGMN